MSADENRSGKRRARRQVEKADLPEGPARRLRDALYELYLRAAGEPTLDELAARIAADENLPGSPGRDTISRIISGRELPATRQDAVTVAIALAHLCGRDSAVIADRVADLWVAAKMAPPDRPPARMGRPVGECDPIALEVHRAIDIPDQDRAVTVLPRYVSRRHDARLAEIVAAAASGNSRIAVLVGDASTGKTRACWEAIQALPDQWRVWHPIDPSPFDAAAAGLQQVGAYTVIWLNEAQHYLLTADSVVGERVAAGLRTLLADRGRGPVLVLATMWREYWSTVAARPEPGSPDLHAQARELLAGADIPVADTFTSTDLQALQDAVAGDVRLAHAVEHAQGGRVTQHLAGVPHLLARYYNAPPAARALIDVAIDVRRFGHPVPIPRALLARATPGYMSDHAWHQADSDWLEQALDYATRPGHGVLGPLTQIRPRIDDASVSGPLYQLADYLLQVGGKERRRVFPPSAFWDAVVSTITDPFLLKRLGTFAFERARYRRAFQCYQRAAHHGELGVLVMVAQFREALGDLLGAESVYRQLVDRGYFEALGFLGPLRQQAGDLASAEMLASWGYAHGGTSDAYWYVAALREHLGYPVDGNLAQQIVDRFGSWTTAELWEQLDNLADAETLYRSIGGDARTNSGMTGMTLTFFPDCEPHDDRSIWDLPPVTTLESLAVLQEQAGDPVGASRIRRFGLAEDGSPANSLDLAVFRVSAAVDSATAVGQGDSGDEATPAPAR